MLIRVNFFFPVNMKNSLKRYDFLLYIFVLGLYWMESLKSSYVSLIYLFVLVWTWKAVHKSHKESNYSKCLQLYKEETTVRKYLQCEWTLIYCICQLIYPCTCIKCFLIKIHLHVKLSSNVQIMQVFAQLTGPYMVFDTQVTIRAVGLLFSLFTCTYTDDS